MKNSNQYAVLGLRALKRAAAKVAGNAIKNNYKIPVWRNGRIEFEIPEHIPAQTDIWFPNEVLKANVRGETLVKAWREYFKLTQKDLAVKAGMKQLSLARLEHGSTKPRKATLKKIAAALGIDLEQLVE